MYSCEHSEKRYSEWYTAYIHSQPLLVFLSAFKLSVSRVQPSTAFIAFPSRHYSPASLSYSFNFLHRDIVQNHGKVTGLWGRRCWEPKCHPLWCVVDNETGRAGWITPWTLFHFLNLCPQASPVTLSHYFPSVCLLLDHIYRLLWGRIKKEEKNPLRKWKTLCNSISLIKMVNKSPC